MRRHLLTHVLFNAAHVESNAPGFSIRIKVGGRNVEVGGEGVTRGGGGVWGHDPPGNF